MNRKKYIYKQNSPLQNRRPFIRRKANERLPAELFEFLRTVYGMDGPIEIVAAEPSEDSPYFSEGWKLFETSVRQLRRTPLLQNFIMEENRSRNIFHRPNGVTSGSSLARAYIDERRNTIYPVPPSLRVWNSEFDYNIWLPREPLDWVRWVNVQLGIGFKVLGSDCPAQPWLFPQGSEALILPYLNYQYFVGESLISQLVNGTVRRPLRRYRPDQMMRIFSRQ